MDDDTARKVDRMENVVGLLARVGLGTGPGCPLHGDFGDRSRPPDHALGKPALVERVLQVRDQRKAADGRLPDHPSPHASWGRFLTRHLFP